MEQQSIGLIISQIIKEKRLSITELASTRKISRQAIYNLPNRDSMTLEEIEEWALAIGVNSQDIIDRSQNKVTTKVDNVVQGDGYLMRYLNELEITIKELRETVRSQAHTIEVLAGKSDNVSLAGTFSFFLPLVVTFVVH